MLTRQEKPSTTWKMGGDARYFVVAKSEEEVQEAVEFASKKSLAVFILGGGSNILVSDFGIDGLVIKMELQGIEFGEDMVTAGSGVMMSRLAAESLNNGFTGLEWAIGLPGTVGGAVFGNSNCWGGSTGKSLVRAKILIEGNLKEVSQEYFKFSYDYSILQDTKEILLSASFKVEKLNLE